MTGIYNPWSILQVLKRPGQKLTDYWNHTGGSALIDELVHYAPPSFHDAFQMLLKGQYTEAPLLKDIEFNNLKGNAEALWTLLFHAGYVKILPEEVKAISALDGWENPDEANDNLFSISLVNYETKICLRKMVRSWYTENETDRMILFGKALLAGDLEMINDRFSDVVSRCVSGFDSGVKPAGGHIHPEYYFHGLTTGMVVGLMERYDITSNGEAGKGRYDLCLESRNRLRDPYAFILEFKVFDEKQGDTSIQDTAIRARQQITDKGYDLKLKNRGFADSEIRKYGVGFRGKDVVIV